MKWAYNDGDSIGGTIFKIKTGLKKAAFLAIASFAFASLNPVMATPPSNEPLATITSIHVSVRAKQGDAHLIEVPGQPLILVDTGSIDHGLVPYLQNRGIKHLGDVVISHVHEDHYGALEDLMTAGIRIDRAWINPVPKTVCDKEIPWGCRYKEVYDLIKKLRVKKTRVSPLFAGKEFFPSLAKKGISFQALEVFDGITKKLPVPNTDVNDTSSILRFRAEKMSMLFTGDLNLTMGKYYADKKKDFSADILKVPHHAAANLAPNEFFDLVQARAAVCTPPLEVWNGERTKQVRDYYATRIKSDCLFVSGLHGTITTKFFADRAELSAETAPAGSTPPKCTLTPLQHSR